MFSRLWQTMRKIIWCRMTPTIFSFVKIKFSWWLMMFWIEIKKCHVFFNLVRVISYAMPPCVVKSEHKTLTTFSFRHWITSAWARFGLAYYYYDTLVKVESMSEDNGQSMTHKEKWLTFMRKDTLMFVHHIILPIVFYPVIIVSFAGFSLFSVIQKYAVLIS